VEPGRTPTAIYSLPSQTIKSVPRQPFVRYYPAQTHPSSAPHLCGNVPAESNFFCGFDLAFGHSTFLHPHALLFSGFQSNGILSVCVLSPNLPFSIPETVALPLFHLAAESRRRVGRRLCPIAPARLLACRAQDTYCQPCAKGSPPDFLSGRTVTTVRPEPRPVRQTASQPRPRIRFPNDLGRLVRHRSWLPG
jgi:hypothetical protein